MKPAALYLAFMADLEKRLLSNLMDPVEQRVIETFTIDWYHQRQLTVMAAMHGVPGMSPSTVHRRLKTLRAKRMLQLVPDAVDTRIKYVHPGPALVGYFEQLGERMRHVVMLANDAARR